MTEGTMADSTQAQALTEGLPAEYLLADKGYDTNAIVARAIAQGMEPVIPPRRHRKEPRDYDRDLYRFRHLVENAFLNFKQWRGWQLATRKDPPPSSPSARFGLWQSGPNYFDHTPYVKAVAG